MAADSGTYTPETIRRRQALADALYNKKQPPMTHWMQGVAHLGDNLTAGLLEQKNKRDRSEANEWLASKLPGAAPAAAAPMAPPAAPSMQPGQPMASTSGKIYSNDEPSPLDPPSGNSRDMLARTLLAEAGNQGPTGMQAVANVIRNRAVAGNFGGDTVEGVIQKPSQFEPWNTAAGRNRMAAIDPNSPQYQTATAAIDQAYTGNDPTGGATHFYAPRAQAALGRPAPRWDNGTGKDIGDHRFFGAPGTPAVTAGATPDAFSAQSRNPVAQALAQPAGQQPAAGAPPNGNMAMIAEMLRSKNPYVSGMGQQLAQQALQNQFGESTPQFTKIGQDADGRDVMGWVNPKKGSVAAASIPGLEAGAGSTVQAPNGAKLNVPAGQRKVVQEAVGKRLAQEVLPGSSEDAGKLRKEVQDLPSYKNLAQAAPVYKSMLEAAGRDNRAADVNLIYGMAKIMDPGSVVRESEMTVAQAIATLPQQLKATVESQLQGSGRLSPEVREALMEEAHSRIGSYKGMFDQDAGMYRGIAQRGRFNEADVLPNFGDFQKYARPGAPAAVAGKPAIDDLLKKYGG